MNIFSSSLSLSLTRGILLLYQYTGYYEVLFYIFSFPSHGGARRFFPLLDVHFQCQAFVSSWCLVYHYHHPSIIILSTSPLESTVQVHIKLSEICKGSGSDGFAEVLIIQPLEVPLFKVLSLY